MDERNFGGEKKNFITERIGKGLIFFKLARD